MEESPNYMRQYLLSARSKLPAHIRDRLLRTSLATGANSSDLLPPLSPDHLSPAPSPETGHQVTGPYSIPPMEPRRSNIIFSAPVKRKVDQTRQEEFSGRLDSGLKGLSPSQLIKIINKITEKHPDIEKEIFNEMPAPDLTRLKEKLTSLKSNVCKSTLTSRLTIKRYSPDYYRVATDLAAFSKCVIEEGNVLIETKHWQSVIKYVFLAWNNVRETPKWDIEPHNTHREQCFKALTKFCMTALQKGNFSKDFYKDIKEKLEGMEADSGDVISCLQYVNGQLQI